MSKIGIVPITIPKSKMLDPEALKRVIINTMEARAKDIKIDLKVTTQTWNNKPSFTITRRSFVWTIGTDDDIYKFVDKGTKVRYAVMTPNFQAKTRVNVIGSRKGVGGFSHFNFKKPKPGIKARNFTKEIAKKWQRLLPNIVERAILSELP